MNIYWHDVEKFLLKKRASQNEINAQRQIFNNNSFQTLLTHTFGILTEKTFFEADEKTELAKASGALNDLGSLDTYELIDFIECHELTFKQASTITPQQMTLLGDGQITKITNALMLGMDDIQDPIRYSLSAIVQTGFPYKRLKGQQHFERKNGNLTVTMSAPNDIGLPSGMYPRLAFVHICSEVIKSQSRSTNLGPTLKTFVMDEMGRPWSTGKKGTAIKWRESLTSLLATSFTIVYQHRDADSNEKGLLLKNVSIVDEANLWWDSKFSELMGAEIKISKPFAEALLNHATPLDIRALKSLSTLRSPLAFDLYCWLTYRYWRMEENHSPIVRISWKQLHEQLGTSIQTVRHFIYETREALKEVKKVYPQASFNSDQNQYIILIKSPPHVSTKRLAERKQLSLEESS